MIFQVTAEPRKDQPSGRAVVWEVQAETPEMALIVASGDQAAQMMAQELRQELQK